MKWDPDCNNDHHNNNVGYINSKLHSNYEALGSDATNSIWWFEVIFWVYKSEDLDVAPVTL